VLIQIAPYTVTTEAGDVVCVQARASVAVSTGVAIRLVPVGPDGTEYPAHALPIVARPGALAQFEAAIRSALGALVPAHQQAIVAQRQRAIERGNAPGQPGRP
jgi:hypothetical protein